MAEQKALFTTQTSTEEIRAIKTVLCDGVPPQVLNKQVLTRHFSRFGNVVKVFYLNLYLLSRYTRFRALGNSGSISSYLYQLLMKHNIH